MNIVIVGQGAIGLLWYTHLTQSKQPSKLDVSLYCSSAYDASIKDVHFTNAEKYESKTPLKAASTSTVNLADVIVLCVKSYQVTHAFNEIAAHIKDNTKIILCHNGMGTFTEIPERVMDNNTILTMLLTHGSYKDGPLSAVHTGLGETRVGLLSGTISEQEVAELIATFHSALPPVDWQHNVIQGQWLKLAVNCVINPLTALNDIDNGQIVNDFTHDYIRTILAEIIDVAAQSKVKLNINELLEMVIGVAKNTATNSSSMRCDIAAARRTEIDYINGYIHKMGIEHNIATPINTALWQQIKQLESGYLN